MAKTKMLNLFLRTNAGIGVHLKYCECSANRTYSNNCGISLTVWWENASKQREPPTSKSSWDWRGKDIMTLLMIWLETDTAAPRQGWKASGLISESGKVGGWRAWYIQTEQSWEFPEVGISIGELEGGLLESQRKAMLSAPRAICLWGPGCQACPSRQPFLLKTRCSHNQQSGALLKISLAALEGRLGRRRSYLLSKLKSPDSVSRSQAFSGKSPDSAEGADQNASVFASNWFKERGFP